jgi:WhiB family redox-sensing transcriptional regulator
MTRRTAAQAAARVAAGAVPSLWLACSMVTTGELEPSPRDVSAGAAGGAGSGGLSRQQRNDHPGTARPIAKKGWQAAAACRSADPDLFFPSSASGKATEQVWQAKAICARCRVRRQCLAFALRTGQAYGIWGGLTERERYQAARACMQSGHPGVAGDERPTQQERPREPASTVNVRAVASTSRPARPPAARIGRGAAASTEELIRLQASAALAACEQMTVAAQQVLRDSVDLASRLPTSAGWERRAAAQAEIFDLLAEVTDNRAAAAVLRGAARPVRDLILSAGPAANGMITGSRQRMLACLRAGDAKAAALELEQHLRALHFMSRLARR